MKKFLFRLGVFIVGFIMINIVFLVLIVLTDWNFKKRIQSLKLDNDDIELLVLGNSLASDGIDTEYLSNRGIESFNIALGGSTLKTNYIQLTEYLEQTRHAPDYILLAFGSYMGGLEGEVVHPIVEFTHKNYSHSFADIPIIKFQWLALELAKKIISSTHRNAEISRGQLRFQKIVADRTTYKAREFDPEYITELKYASEICKICSVYNIQLIIIEMPGFKDTQNSSDIGPFEVSFGKEFSVSIYNFNSNGFCQVFDSDTDWIGNSHLNEFGAKKFTEQLYEIVFRNYEIR